MWDSTSILFLKGEWYEFEGGIWGRWKGGGGGGGRGEGEREGGMLEGHGESKNTFMEKKSAK